MGMILAGTYSLAYQSLPCGDYRRSNKDNLNFTRDAIDGGWRIYTAAGSLRTCDSPLSYLDRLEEIPALIRAGTA